jgi:hypothetical protein
MSDMGNFSILKELAQSETSIHVGGNTQGG